MDYNPNQPLYGLSLNNIFDRMENRNLVAVSYDKNKLLEFMKQHLAEAPYHHEIGGRTYYLNFKLGSPLERFNPPYQDEDAIIYWKSEADFLDGYREQLKHIMQTHTFL